MFRTLCVFVFFFIKFLVLCNSFLTLARFPNPKLLKVCSKLLRNALLFSKRVLTYGSEISSL